MKKIIIVLFLCLLLFPTKIASAATLKLTAESVLAYDLDSGKVLYEKNAKEAVPVASLSKALTAYLVYQAVDTKKISWNTKVKISDYPYELTANYDISNVPLDQREYTVKELLEAMLVTNANSAAIALAEKISGTEPLFVDLMKKQLKEWEITDSKVVNATGLPNNILGDNTYSKAKASAENKFSALDLAIVSRHLLQDYPQILKITGQASSTFAGNTIFSYNYMLEDMPYARPGIDGLFVGHSDKSGSSFMASSQENKMHIVTIVLNANNTDDSEFKQFEATNDLLNYIYSHYEKVPLLKKNKTYTKGSLPVSDSPQEKIALSAKSSLYAIQKIGQDNSSSIEMTPLEKQVFAPVKSNQVLAKSSFKDKDMIGIGYLGELPSTDLISKKDVPKSFFLKVWWNHFVHYVNSSL